MWKTCFFGMWRAATIGHAVMRQGDVAWRDMGSLWLTEHKAASAFWNPVQQCMLGYRRASLTLT